jgi:micrococcal nuclease
MRLNWLGSAALVLLVAGLLLRPWEGLGGADAVGPASARVFVDRVVDGDTIEVELDGVAEDVRYIGVDTPETVKPDSPVECFGPQASSFNHRLVEGRQVRLVFGVERRDIYDRLLAYVYFDHRFVNAELLRKGFARTLTFAPNDRFAERFKRLEIAAARHGRGLWSECES